MRFCLRFTAFAPLALGCSLLAHGTSFTQTVQFGPGPTDYSNSTGTTSANGSQFYFFDSNGGTLNSITFAYSYSFTSAITVINTSISSSSGTVRAESGAQFTSNSSAINNVLNNGVNKNGSVQFGNSTLSPIAFNLFTPANSYSLTPGAAYTLPSSTASSSSSLTDTSAGDLAAFTQAGGGTFTPLFSTLTGFLLSNSGGNTNAFQTANAQGSLSLTYNYTAAAAPVSVTPEPSSLVLLGTGALGLLGAARRRLRVS